MTATRMPQLVPVQREAPQVAIRALDVLWFQVAGTICNLRCRHCFIGCSPDNDTFGFMPLDLCRRYLDESRALGVREYYFTGGEPFAHPQILEILAAALPLAPVTVLTNGTLLDEPTLSRLGRMAGSSTYSLELRVSLDGFTAEMNDPIRGAGTFDRIMDGVKRLVEHGFLPIVTVTRTWGEDAGDAMLAGFIGLLKSAGYDRPRVKLMPMLRIGAEVARCGGYGPDDRVTRDMMVGYDDETLLCASARLATNRGVWVCPILPDAPDARLGTTLADSLRPYALRHAACVTCWQYGAICANPTSTLPGAS